MNAIIFVLIIPSIKSHQHGENSQTIAEDKLLASGDDIMFTL